MTNNEFPLLFNIKIKFKLAIIQQGKRQFDVCIINNPVNVLVLTKRVTRWEWYCSNYSGDIFQAELED